MRHDWYDPRLPREPSRLSYEKRKCRNCGKEQTEYREYAWQRLVSRQWLPLAGRCKPQPRSTS